MVANSNQHFQHEMETTASAEQIWAMWTDVTCWKDWDQGLRAASMEGPFMLGSTGKLIDNGGRSSTFRITAFDPHVSYAFATRLPFGSLEVRRTILATDPCRFQHEVKFEGVGGWLLSNILGPSFRKVLPPTMQTLSELSLGRHLGKSQHEPS